MENLLQEFRNIEINFTKKGLSQKQVHKELLKHIRDTKTLTNSQSGIAKCKKIALYAIPVIIAVAVTFSLMFKKDILEVVKTTKCLVEPNVLMAEIGRPLQDCSLCANLKSVPILKDISKNEFLQKYAYTGVPVLIKEATKNWTAMETFNFEYFKKIYTEKEDTLDVIDQDCQFFGYKTEFDSLGDALSMSKDRADYKPGEKPWYFGW